MKKLGLIITIILAISILLPGCGNTGSTPTSSETENPITVIDFRGKEITLDSAPQRIACLIDSSMSMLHMLGVREEVAAVHKWTNNEGNPGYKFYTQIDPRIARGELPTANGDVEKILSVNPDLVIIWAQETIIDELESAGIKVYAVQINKFDEVYKLMEDLGKMTGKSERATGLIEYTKAEMTGISGILNNIPEDKKINGLFIWGPTLLDIAGGTSTGGDIFKVAGANNLAEGIDAEHSQVNLEQIILWNPEVIALWNSVKYSPEDIYNDPVWADIAAVKNQRIFKIPDGFNTDLWTLKYVFAVKVTAMEMYPEYFSGINLDIAGKQMLEKLYDYDFK